MTGLRPNTLRLGIDVGGTFTDFVLVSDTDVRLYKRLSTPEDPSIGVIGGLMEMAERFGFAVADLDEIVHGTTVVANALIERKGQPTGLITTEGFRDVIEIGREVRYDIYDLGIENPEPLAPRHLRVGLAERTLADGTVRSAPAPDAIRAAARQLEAAGARTIAVCLIHGHRNPANERLVSAVLTGEFPHLLHSLSSTVAPEIREYERMSTTVANAYVHPLLNRYLGELEAKLAGLEFGGSLYIMLSQGGITTVDYARRLPIQIVESGPAAGVQAACFLGRIMGADRLLSFDMGGTTAKACVIDDCRPDYTMNTEVARIHRFKKGSGLPLLVPSVELLEIGAGGGSIARLDSMDFLKIGPESAGANPGPACYGLGGRRPTVTDADLVLGYLNPDNFLGGEMRLDADLARAAIAEQIATPLGVPVLEAAAGIVRLANENMATAARLHIAERGRDPQRYSLVAFGGAGPVHAFGVARALRLGTMIVPPGAGNLSALGFLVAPVAVSAVRTYVQSIERLDWVFLRRLYAEMTAEADGIMEKAGTRPDEVERRLTAEMRYVGQGYEVGFEITAADLDAEDAGRLRTKFEDAYAALFEMRLGDVPVEAMNWRLMSRGRSPSIPAPAAGGTAGAEAALTGRRPIWLPEQKAFGEAAVYDRYRLAPGTRFAGPAIVEERESTVVINGAADVEVDRHGNLIVSLKP